jgi:hypothetical protein
MGVEDRPKEGQNRIPRSEMKRLGPVHEVVVEELGYS